MSASAYQQTQKVAESPRQREYRLFGQITADMIAAREAGLTGADLVDCLHRNRELWSALAADCAAEGNALPNETRAGIVSLSLFIQKHTSKVIRGVENIDDLITYNRNIMAGLAPSPMPEAA